MKYFKPREFREWYSIMDGELLICLDNFRELWGKPVFISSHKDALGRHLGSSSKSMHNVDVQGMVRAVDFFPQGMITPSDMAKAYLCAIEAGFTGIGIYTDTKPSNMMHGDVRDTHEIGDPAKWARVDGNYVGIEEVIK